VVQVLTEARGPFRHRVLPAHCEAIEQVLEEDQPVDVDVGIGQRDLLLRDVDDQDVGLRHADVVLDHQPLTAAGGGRPQAGVIELQFARLVDSRHEGGDQWAVLGLHPVDMGAVDGLRGQSLLDAVQLLVQVHDHEMQTVACFPLPCGEPPEVVPGDPILRKRWRPRQQELHALLIRSRGPVAVGRRRTGLAANRRHHRADIVHEHVMDSTARWDHVGVGAFSPAARDHRVQFGIRKAARKPLLLEIGHRQVRMVRVFTGDLQQRHQILGPVVGSQGLVDQGGQEQSRVADLADDSALGQDSAALESAVLRGG
jgi:hypothetical protein